MFKELLEFHNEVGKKTSFWLPILLFAIGAYSFSILNPTISIDDLNRDLYVGEGNLMLAGRWGMVLWVKLFGITEYSPFIDRYLALIFLLLAAYLACVAFHAIKPVSQTLPYTILASLIVTYPLINEIWEYTGANFVSTGNMVLGTLAIIILLRGSNLPAKAQAKCMLTATVLLLLPCSSYESGIFYYISFVAFIIFHELITAGRPYGIHDFAGKMLRYILPLASAFALRIIITSAILKIYHLHFHMQGQVECKWLTHKPFLGILARFFTDMETFALSGLIYFPITIMLFASVVIIIAGFIFSWKIKSWQPVVLGGIAVISVFLLPIIMGEGVLARTALPFHILTAYAGYLILSSLVQRKTCYFSAAAAIIMLCIHQSTYLNSILSLNHIRSENELGILRNIALELIKKHPEKPVIFAAGHSTHTMFVDRFYLNLKAWNHRLYKYIYENHVAHRSIDTFKYVGTNLNPCTIQKNTYPYLFSYLGFKEIRMVPLDTPDGERMLKEAVTTAAREKFSPYSIHDMGDYVVVVLSTQYGYLW